MATLEPDLIHTLKNKVAVAEGFSRLLVEDLPVDDARRQDAQRVHDTLVEVQRLLPLLQAELKRAQSAQE